MEKMTYAEYLQANMGNVPIQECLDVIARAEMGEMTDLDVEQELTPVVGNILLELYHNDPETFDYVIGVISEAAEKIREADEGETFALDHEMNGVELVTDFNSVLDRLRDGFTLKDHWLDEDGRLIVYLTESQAE